MERRALGNSLLGAAAVLALVGLLNCFALGLAVPVALAGIAIRVGLQPTAILAAAWACIVLSVIGFIMLALLSGKLEYSVTGYLIVWGPYLFAFFAVVLLVIHFAVSNKRSVSDGKG